MLPIFTAGSNLVFVINIKNLLGRKIILKSGDFVYWYYGNRDANFTSLSIDR